MIVAVGQLTGKIYARGKCKVDVMRQLHKEYDGDLDKQTLDSLPDSKKYNIYPEPLQLYWEDES